MFRKIFSIVILIVVLGASVTFPARRGFASPAAVTFTVNSHLDQPDDLTIPGTCHTSVNTCTLRAAVMQANRISGFDITILVPSGVYTLTIPIAAADGEENGDLNLTAPSVGSPVITLLGAGASTTIIDGNRLDRVFNISSGRTAGISGVTIRNGSRTPTATGGGGIINSGILNASHITISGNTASTGGGIENDSVLTIDNSIISGNHAGGGGGFSNLSSLTIIDSTISQNVATGDGGGIENGSSLNVINSTISLNTSPTLGGGIWNSTFGVTNVSASTVYANSATDGGGIYNLHNLFLTNSTLTQNNAANRGGGIFNLGTANVYNTSIVFNSAETDTASGGSAGGVYNYDPFMATFNLRNTLVVGNNVANSPIYDDCTGTFTSYGNNLFWQVTACTVNNAPGGNHATLNSLADLGPLQNNGGPTWTVALLPGSNAIDGADPIAGCVDSNGFLLASDQRGYARVVGARCDVGAFEYSPPVHSYLPFIVR